MALEAGGKEVEQLHLQLEEVFHLRCRLRAQQQGHERHAEQMSYGFIENRGRSVVALERNGAATVRSEFCRSTDRFWSAVICLWVCESLHDPTTYDQDRCDT